MIKVLLVDDQPAVRKGLRMRLLLEPDITVIGEAADGAEAVDQAHALCPDVVVMDLEMPRMNGLTSTKLLNLISPNIAIILLSLYRDNASLLQAEDADVYAYIEKGSEIQDLIDTIRCASRDRSKKDD